jgi:type VI secretion system protein ImpK
VAADADSFRAHVKHLLVQADQEARRSGYDAEYVRLAVYAFIAFLDESVLNSSQAMFAAWPRQPLQEEIFGDHMAGETFFLHLQKLLAWNDSEEVADTLEVFLLCLLLGFRGRYGAQGRAAVQGLIYSVDEKITRIRGGRPGLSPAWALPRGEQAPAARDPWLPRLGIAAAVSAASATTLYLLFWLLLGSKVDELREVAARLLP